MTHDAKFDWGKAYYAGIRLGYDEGYAAFRADQMEKRRRIPCRCEPGYCVKDDKPSLWSRTSGIVCRDDENR